MATAKFKISDLTDNITSADLLSTPANYDFIINDISSGTAETKKIGLDTLKSGIFGSPSSPSGDIVINGNIDVVNPDGPYLGVDRPSAGLVQAYEFFVNVDVYTGIGVPKFDGTDFDMGFPPGYSFSGDRSGLPEGGNDTGMFWDGDDRVYINTGNRPGLLVARRKRPTGTSLQGDIIEVIRDGDSYDPGGNHVGINIETPTEKLHIVGNLRVDNDAVFKGPNGEDFTNRTGVVLSREYFVNVSDYTFPPMPGETQGVFLPGYSFAKNPEGDQVGSDPTDEGGNDTGMFWDGDDRLYLLAGNKKGVVVASRVRGTEEAGRGDVIVDENGDRMCNVGVNVTNPRSRLHVHGDIRVDNNDNEVSSTENTGGGIIMQKPDGSGYVRITLNSAGNGFVFNDVTVDSGEGDAAYEAAVEATGVYYDKSKGRQF